MKQWNKREIHRTLKNNGYRPQGGKNQTKGDHVKYRNDDGHLIVITVNMNPVIFNRIIRENGLKV